MHLTKPLPSISQTIHSHLVSHEDNLHALASITLLRDVPYALLGIYFSFQVLHYDWTLVSLVVL